MLDLDMDILGVVVARALESAADNKPCINAVRRAHEELCNNPWIEDCGTHLLIGSPSGETYEANGHCQCAAYLHGYVWRHNGTIERSRICWHRAAAKLVRRYAEEVARREQADRQEFGRKLARARAFAEMNELFA